MCPDSIIPGLYSEGEFPVSEGQAILSALEDLEDGKLYLQRCDKVGLVVFCAGMLVSCCLITSQVIDSHFKIFSVSLSYLVFMPFLIYSKTSAIVSKVRQCCAMQLLR